MSSVDPIPAGSHTITPHLVVQGAADAIEFYKKAFGAEELFRMPGPDGKSVMHAELQFGNSRLYICDEFPDMGACGPKSVGGTSVTIHLYVEDADAVAKQAESAGAKVVMPVTTVFWGDRYGKLEDPFGHNWSVATHVEDVAPEDMAKRAAEAMGGGN
ncbi:MAG: VOC family protein [Planctomycetota bacterium]